MSLMYELPLRKRQHLSGRLWAVTYPGFVSNPIIILLLLQYAYDFISGGDFSDASKLSAIVRVFTLLFHPAPGFINEQGIARGYLVPVQRVITEHRASRGGSKKGLKPRP